MIHYDLRFMNRSANGVKIFWRYWTMIGFCGFFGKIIYGDIQNLQKTTVGGDVSKDTLVVLIILFVLGFIGLLSSNKAIDALNKLENAT